MPLDTSTSVAWLPFVPFSSGLYLWTWSSSRAYQHMRSWTKTFGDGLDRVCPLHIPNSDLSHSPDNWFSLGVGYELYLPHGIWLDGICVCTLFDLIGSISDSYNLWSLSICPLNTQEETVLIPFNYCYIMLVNSETSGLNYIHVARKDVIYWILEVKVPTEQIWGNAFQLRTLNYFSFFHIYVYL